MGCGPQRTSVAPLGSLVLQLRRCRGRWALLYRESGRAGEHRFRVGLRSDGFPQPPLCLSNPTLLLEAHLALLTSTWSLLPQRVHSSSFSPSCSPSPGTFLAGSFLTPFSPFVVWIIPFILRNKWD